MPTILVEVSHHHESDKSDYKGLLDIPDGADANVHALLLALNDEFGIDADRDADRVAAALEKAKETGEDATFEVRNYSGLEEDDEPDPELDETYENKFTVWYKITPGVYTLNFGFGEGDGLDKYTNVWLKVRPYEPDPAMRERLEKLDKEQLLEIILRAYAERSLPFPPSI